ncbi:hypothetical protein [Prosthecochloris sp.]|uniref:hypothetical protein n=1 Tax=Prosthecochloris sp. TaxID=290513 RepID=UPI0025806A7C|nr:hypothetical protein [Prosthecochloris sp.]
MVLFFLFLVQLGPIKAYSAEWFLLNEGPSYKAYIDAESVEKDGDIISAWIRGEIKEGEKPIVSRGENVSEIAIRFQTKISAKKSRYVVVIYYDDDHRVISSKSSYNAVFFDDVSGSVGASWAEFLRETF